MTRPMVTVGIPFLTATLVASFFNTTQAIVCIVVLFVLLGAVYFVKKNRLLLTVILISCLVGISGYTLKTSIEVARVTQLAEQTVTIKAVVTDTFVNQKGTYGYELNVMQVDNHAKTPKFKTRLYSVVPLDVDYYDAIQIKASFFQISSTTSFDTQQYYMQKQIYLLAFAKGEPIEIISPRNKPIAYHFKQMNEILSAKVDALLLQPASGIVKAMALGNRDDIDTMTARAFSLAGIMHIVAISGLHIAIVAGFLFFLFERLGVSERWRVLLVMLLIWGFVALTNFHVSTIRAAIMITVLLVGRLFGRPAQSTNSLFLAGVLIVLANPFAIRDVGFLLTFLATLGILTALTSMSQWVHRKLGIKNKLLSKIITMMCCTLSVNLFVLPVMLITFKSVSLVALFTNIVAISIAPILLIAIIIMLGSSFAAFLAPVTQLLAFIVTFLVRALTSMCDWVATLPFASIGMDYPFVRVWLLVSGGFLLASLLYHLLWNTKKKPPFAKLIIGSLVGLVLFTVGYRAYHSQTLQISTIGSYETQAIVLIYQKKATVINLKTDGYCNQSVVDFLDENNIKDVDHYINIEQNTKTISDTALLLKTKSVAEVVLHEKNNFIHYATNHTPPQTTVVTLDKLYTAKLGKTGTITALQTNEGGVVFVEYQNRIICFTNSEQIAQEVNCEFSYVLLENANFAKQFPSKYVILLSDSSSDQSNEQNTYFQAHDNKIKLNILQNGKYKLRRVN